MPDLDYAKVIQRLGMPAGDTPDDPDDYPDTIWCDEGRVQIIPENTYVKVADGSPVPWTGGNAVIECEVSGADYVDPTDGGFDGPGYLTYNGKPYVWVVDLTSTKVNPAVGADLATHKVRYVDVRADGTPVEFPDALCRFTAAGDGVSPDNMNDITILAPVVSGAPTPIYRGVQGTSITDLAIVGGTNLEVSLDDGTTVDAGELPVGPGGSDGGVAGYLLSPTSQTSEQAAEAALDPDHPLGAAIAELLADIPTEAP